MSPKSAPRAAQDAPRRRQEAPEARQERPKRPKALFKRSAETAAGQFCKALGSVAGLGAPAPLESGHRVITHAVSVTTAQAV